MATSTESPVLDMSGGVKDLQLNDPPVGHQPHPDNGVHIPVSAPSSNASNASNVTATASTSNGSSASTVNGSGSNDASKTNGTDIQPQGSAAQPTRKEYSPREIKLIVAALMCGQFLASLDGTIVGIALPKIVGEFKGLSLFSWVIAAYLLMSAATTPLFGKFSDRYGRQPVFQFITWVFAVGSIVCGAAPDMTTLIIGRGIQGLGGGGLISMSQIVIADIASPRDRGRYMGFMGSAFAIASVLGPLLGGAITDGASWRWCFYINLPFCGLTSFIAYKYMHIPRYTGKMPPLDWQGAASVFSATAILVVAITWGGDKFAWDSAVIICLIVVSVLLYAFFFWQELRHEEPIINLRLFMIRNYWVSCVMMFMIGASLIGLMSFLPLYFQIIHNKTAVQSGLSTMPMMFLLIVASMFCGGYISKTGKYRWAPLIGSCLVTLGAGLLVSVKVDTAYGVMAVYMMILGIGVGVSLPSLGLIAQNSVPQKDAAVATAGAAFFRTLGGTVATAVFGTVLSNQLGSKLAAHHLPEAMKELPASYVWSSAFEAFRPQPPRLRPPLSPIEKSDRWVFLPQIQHQHECHFAQSQLASPQALRPRSR